ncbi:hypothetical protein ACHAWC_003678 [Mediolabrus comicus]
MEEEETIEERDSKRLKATSQDAEQHSLTADDDHNDDKPYDLVMIDNINQRLQNTRDNFLKKFDEQIQKLNDEEKCLRTRLDDVTSKIQTCVAENGNVENISDNDTVEINAGGKIVAVKRGTLTQIKGTRLEALFSGRWDNKLLRDNSGRLFLDVNGDCFQSIVDYLNELSISSEEDRPDLPTVDRENEHIMNHQVELFGLKHQFLDSNIIKTQEDEQVLHRMLREDGSDGEMRLLYRSSRDGSMFFHSRCDNKGPTIAVIETSDGGVFGGFTNESWKSVTGQPTFAAADKAFLFALSTASPCKMKLKRVDGERAIVQGGNLAFGSDLSVIGTGGGIHGQGHLCFRLGKAYKLSPYHEMNASHEVPIKEIEVFQVSDDSPPSQLKVFNEATFFTREINEAINEKFVNLQNLERDVFGMEKRLKEEKEFIETFASGDANDVVMLNVSGTMMATNRATLLFAEESVLAAQFDDSKWTKQGSNSMQVSDWSVEDVSNWAKNVRGIQEDVSKYFKENSINGHELLALNEAGLKMLGLDRVGTICLLLKEIKTLEKASKDVVTLIEHSPYCFGKMLDILRMKRLHSINLAEGPGCVMISDSQQKRFEKVVNFYFPGESSTFILDKTFAEGAKVDGRPSTNAPQPLMAPTQNIQQAVIDCIRFIGSNNDRGANINLVILQLIHRGFSESELRSTVEQLSNEGIIYSTIDERHFQIAE